MKVGRWTSHRGSGGLELGSRGSVSPLDPMLGPLPFPACVTLEETACPSQPGRRPKNKFAFPSLPIDGYGQKPTFAVELREGSENLRPESYQILWYTFPIKKKLKVILLKTKHHKTQTLNLSFSAFWCTEL